MMKITTKPHFKPAVISAAMLIIALLLSGACLDMAKEFAGYYILLRFVVCGSAAYLAFLSYRGNQQWFVWLEDHPQTPLGIVL